LGGELLHLVYRWTGQTSAGKHIARRVKACRSAESWRHRNARQKCDIWNHC